MHVLGKVPCAPAGIQSVTDMDFSVVAVYGEISLAPWPGAGIVIDRGMRRIGG